MQPFIIENNEMAHGSKGAKGSGKGSMGKGGSEGFEGEDSDSMANGKDSGFKGKAGKGMIGKGGKGMIGKGGIFNTGGSDETHGNGEFGPNGSTDKDENHLECLNCFYGSGEDHSCLMDLSQINEEEESVNGFIQILAGNLRKKKESKESKENDAMSSLYPESGSEMVRPGFYQIILTVLVSIVFTAGLLM